MFRGGDMDTGKSSEKNVQHALLMRALDGAREGITIADAQQPGTPLIYVNRGFEKLTGYLPEEAVGRNYQLLYGTDSGQPEVAVINTALAEGKECTVLLRSYRKDGSMFWNQFSLEPVHDSGGKLTHFIGILRDATDRGHLATLPDALTGTDPLLGIASRKRFDERFADLMHVAQRIHSGISLLMIDLDQFGKFNELYGQTAGNECLRRVGECILRSFKRSSDCVARYGGEEFAVLSFSSGLEALHQHARKVSEQVRMLNIPHSGSQHGIVTISIGGLHRLPGRDTTREELIEIAERELQAAKHGGRDRVHIT